MKPGFWGVQKKGAVTVPVYGSTSGTVVNTADGYNAFPGLLQRTDGTLYCAYRHGSAHISTDGALVYKTSTDQGATWGARTTIVAADATYEWRDVSLAKTSSGRWILNTFRYIDSTAAGNVVVFTSDDEGVTWSAPITPTTSWSHSASTGPVVQRADGTLLMPIYGAADFTTTAMGVVKSSDNGATWGSQVTVLDMSGSGVSVGEASLVMMDGDVHAYIRRDTGGSSTAVYRCISYDGGATWSSAVQVTTQYPNRPTVDRFPSTGAMVLCHRKVSTAAAVWSYSLDRGGSWTMHSPDYSTAVPQYSALCVLADGSMGMVTSLESSASVAQMLYQQIVKQ